MGSAFSESVAVTGHFELTLDFGDEPTGLTFGLTFFAGFFFRLGVNRLILGVTGVALKSFGND